MRLLLMGQLLFFTLAFLYLCPYECGYIESGTEN